MPFTYKWRTLFIFALVLTVGLLGYPTASSHSQVLAESVNSATETAQPMTPLLDNLGNHHHPISTQSKLAQRYFDQGLILAYGFNHAEAARSFKEAARLDPDCAMCYWGLAYVLGPNINAPMELDAVPEAWLALQKALELSKNASPKEKAYIEALAQRYSFKAVEDRQYLNIAYANAMRQVAQNYPEDLDAATLFVEALMDTTPWDYWNTDGTPKPEGAEMMATLDRVLMQNPNHPGANHLYIHAVEKGHPELGIVAADRLQNLVAGAGHLLHMPSHIYFRVGRYRDAVLSNQRAIEADKSYITQCHAQGLYPLGYVPHNHHFLWYAATMAGQSNIAMQAAHHTAEMADPNMMREPGYGTLQHYYSIPLYTQIKFGKWDEILAQSAPEKDLLYPTGVWHYARGMAFTAKGEKSQAAQELEQLKAIATNPVLEKVTIWDINSTASLLKIASEVLAGELAAKQENYEQAIAHLKTAVQLEDNLKYDEPPPWYSPTRQSLGAVLLEAGQASEAERIYREDLKTYPENGWSLRGLAKSLQAQGKTEEAQAVQQQFSQAWKDADVTLTASRF